VNVGCGPRRQGPQMAPIAQLSQTSRFCGPLCCHARVGKHTVRARVDATGEVQEGVSVTSVIFRATDASGDWLDDVWVGCLSAPDGRVTTDRIVGTFA
jgi:hypothetical protein